MHSSYVDQQIENATPFTQSIAASWYADATVWVHDVLKNTL